MKLPLKCDETGFEIGDLPSKYDSIRQQQQRLSYDGEKSSKVQGDGIQCVYLLSPRKYKICVAVEVVVVVIVDIHLCDAIVFTVQLYRRKEFQNETCEKTKTKAKAFVVRITCNHIDERNTFSPFWLFIHRWCCWCFHTIMTWHTRTQYTHTHTSQACKISDFISLILFSICYATANTLILTLTRIH